MYRTQKADEKSDVIRLVMFTPKVMVIRMSKMAHFMHCLLHTEENRPSLGKIFICTLKVLFGPFTKYYGLCSSDLIFANCQHLKIQNFTSTLLTQHFFFFIFLPTISHEQLRPKPVKHTIFCKNLMRSSTCT